MSLSSPKDNISWSSWFQASVITEKDTPSSINQRNKLMIRHGCISMWALPLSCDGGDLRVHCTHLGISSGRGILPELDKLVQKAQTRVIESSGGVDGG
jgi:hypothetical protein